MPTGQRNLCLLNRAVIKNGLEIVGVFWCCCFSDSVFLAIYFYCSHTKASAHDGLGPEGKKLKEKKWFFKMA